MREILFRGKLKDKDEWIGEWIEGIYCPCYWDLYMRRVEKPRIIILSNKGKTDGLWREVIPETVGQFTGLTDKNGVRIFEGDILKSTIKIIDYADVGFSISHYDEEDIGIVEWRKDGFMIAHKSGTWARSFYGCENYVIGNIHDNPEILKGGGDNG